MNSKALYNLTYGLFLLSANENGKDNGCIINTAVQVANEPTRISISVIRGNKTCDMILASGKFNISAITDTAPFELFRHFGMQSGRDADKFAGYESAARSENGLYYLTEHSNMFLSAKVTEKIDLGSHILFIAEVTDGEVLSDGNSCTYGFYQSHIKPKTKKSAKKQWVCTVCGYVYEGEEVPDDFLCPLCKHGKEDFELAGDETPKEETKWICSVCGYVHTGESAPENCPVCKVDQEFFKKETGRA